MHSIQSRLVIGAKSIVFVFQPRNLKGSGSEGVKTADNAIKHYVENLASHFHKMLTHDKM